MKASNKVDPGSIAITGSEPQHHAHTPKNILLIFPWIYYVWWLRTASAVPLWAIEVNTNYASMRDSSEKEKPEISKWQHGHTNRKSSRSEKVKCEFNAQIDPHFKFITLRRLRLLAAYTIPMQHGVSNSITLLLMTISHLECDKVTISWKRSMRQSSIQHRIAQSGVMRTDNQITWHFCSFATDQQPIDQSTTIRGRSWAREEIRFANSAKHACTFVRILNSGKMRFDTLFISRCELWPSTTQHIAVREWAHIQYTL